VAPLSATARRGLARSATRPLLAPWPELREELAEHWRPGQHLTILGPTGTGKTTLMMALVERRDPVVVIATKRRDSLIRRLERSGWQIVGTVEELRKAARSTVLERYFGDGQTRPRRLVLWASPPGSIRARRKAQAEEIRRALDYAYSAGGWTVAVDESLYLAQDLRLEPELRALWHEGRSSGVSLVCASQRPSWLPRSGYSAASFLLMFSTNDANDVVRLRDIGGGVDPKLLARELGLLRRFEFLCVAPRERPPVLIRSRVELDE
jgi:ABC transporter